MDADEDQEGREKGTNRQDAKSDKKYGRGKPGRFVTSTS
jgi:hypothetical protein